jgi:anti-sigma factor RsiW
MKRAGMNCSTARELLEEYFEGTLPTRRREEVSAHVSVCAGCAEELAQIQKVATALSAIPMAEPSVDVLRAIASRAATLPAPGARRVLVSGWRQVAVLAAAFVAVLAASSYGFPLAWPKIAAALTPAVAWLGKEAALTLAWLEPKLEAILVLFGAAGGLAEPVGTVATAMGPTLGLYAAGELALLAGMILLFRWGRRRAHARAATFVL